MRTDVKIRTKHISSIKNPEKYHTFLKRKMLCTLLRIYTATTTNNNNNKKPTDHGHIAMFGIFKHNVLLIIEMCLLAGRNLSSCWFDYASTQERMYVK